MEGQMTCLECGTTLVVSSERHAYVECGVPNVTLENIEVRRCPNCNTAEVVIPRQEQLHALLAERIARKDSRLAAEEVRFLRKHLGWSNQDFAATFGVREETVSRWQNSEPMQGPAERLLRAMILSAVEPKSDYWIDCFRSIRDRDGIATPSALDVQRRHDRWDLASA
jgi:putative zinc finger/helix-turn-helix YgiT family protein